MTVTTTLLSFDTIGMFAAFSQLIRIICLFRLLGVYFGEVLETLLVNFGDYVDGTTISDNNEFILNRSSSKGKFDTYRRSIRTFDNLIFKMPFYLISWVLKVVAILLTKIAEKQQKIKKWVYYFVFYHSKLHFGIFNTMLSQGILLTSRTILHTKLFPPGLLISLDKLVAILCLFLMVVDFVLLFKTVIDYMDCPLPDES